MDVSPKQIVSVAAALIPFLEHDDANRALMGSNMQRQAVPLLEPEAPIVGTGMEERPRVTRARCSSPRRDGVVTSVTAERIVIETDDGRARRVPAAEVHPHQPGHLHQPAPDRRVGERVDAGQPLADSYSTERGELALGQNVLVAFMSWEGGNFEDAILISESLVREDKFTSIHIEKHEVEARDTKLGPEEITRDIPNVGEDTLRDLDENGIIRIGAEVGAGDILVGKITPKGETELTAEERLLRAIFGEKAREVKDTSLRVPHGERGKVVDVASSAASSTPSCPPGVKSWSACRIAQKRKIRVGDKMAGRHGNKGVVARILPAEDMPFLPDGTPGRHHPEPAGRAVPHEHRPDPGDAPGLGAATRKGVKFATPVFDGATEEQIRRAEATAGLPETARSSCSTAVRASRSTGGHGRLHLHVEADPPGRGQDPRPLHGAVLADHPAAAGWQGAVRRPALRRDGGVGAGGVRRGPHAPGDPDRQVGRRRRSRQDLRGHRQGRGDPAAGVPESFKVLVKELQSWLNVEILNEMKSRSPSIEDDSSGYLICPSSAGSTSLSSGIDPARPSGSVAHIFSWDRRSACPVLLRTGETPVPLGQRSSFAVLNCYSEA